MNHLRRHSLLFLLALSLCLGLARPSILWAEGLVNLSEEEFVLGNIEFALLHELAHLLIWENDIPVLGAEESAADHIATTFLVRGEGEDPAQARRLQGYAQMAAIAFETIWQFAVEIGLNPPYWDEHGLSIQRYFDVLCLIYGSNPDAYRDMVGRGALPEKRAQNCQAEFARSNKAVEWLLDNYGVDEEAFAENAIEVVYEAPRTKVERRFLDLMQERNLVESTLKAYQDRFEVSEAFSVILRRCGVPEAGWQPATRELVICYELLDAYQSLYLRASARSG